jgi:cell division inhibitor SepF
MASFGRKLMVYLGLSEDDDDYDEYEDDYAEDPPPPRRVSRPVAMADPEPPPPPLRPLPREDHDRPTLQSRPAVVRTAPMEKQVVHIVAPSRFADAQEIGDRLKASEPVIVNLQLAERDLSRRMIDFCSGVAYALGGSMEKVAEQVFLLSPSNVVVSAEARASAVDPAGFDA